MTDSNLYLAAQQYANRMKYRRPKRTAEQRLYGCLLINSALMHLRAARADLARAGCQQTLRKVRSALKSADGAFNNARAHAPERFLL